MRTLKFLTIALLATGMLNAQEIPESQVPSVIVNTFKQQFPKASDVEWERKGDEHVVEFEIGLFQDHKAWFAASGAIIRYSKEISKRQVPDAVKNTLKNKYPEYRIDDAKLFVENGVQTYRIEIEKGREDLDLLFSEDGNIL